MYKRNTYFYYVKCKYMKNRLNNNAECIVNNKYSTYICFKRAAAVGYTAYVCGKENTNAE